MKTNINLKILILLFSILISASVIAQSDYEMVQSYKSRHQQILEGIKNAAALNDLTSIESEITTLRRDFEAKKTILDKSLYPDDFETSLEKLNMSLELRKGDFTQIDVLQTEVVTLTGEVDRLNKQNTELINQIQVLEAQHNKDSQTISKLEKLVANLKASLLKRDELVYSIIDSLVPKLSGDISALTQQDKAKIYSEAEKNNVLSNVKRSIRDNNRFIEVTSLKPVDLVDVKKKQQDFVTLWQKVGPKLVDIYAGKADKTQELKDIDNLFSVWKSNLQKEAWNSIREEFALNNINLQTFTNGNEFTDVINRFINDEIKFYGSKSKVASEQTYFLFANSTWFKSISTEWIPYLIDNNLLTVEQKDSMEKQISEWKSTLYPASLTWLYVLLAVIILAIGGYFLMRRKGSKTPPVDVTKV